MTRSEEELRVDTAQRERGRVRLRKYVITEHVEQAVPVRRERVRVEREWFRHAIGQMLRPSGSLGSRDSVTGW
jgi:uncharacterized protein (TIGR02271 family)